MLFNTETFLPDIPTGLLWRLAKLSYTFPAGITLKLATCTAAGFTFDQWRNTYFEADPNTFDLGGEYFTPTIEPAPLLSSLGADVFPDEVAFRYVENAKTLGEWLAACDFGSLPNWLPAAFLDPVNPGIVENAWQLPWCIFLWSIGGAYQTLLAWELFKLLALYEKPPVHSNKYIKNPVH